VYKPSLPPCPIQSYLLDDRLERPGIGLVHTCNMTEEAGTRCRAQIEGPEVRATTASGLSTRGQDPLPSTESICRSCPTFRWPRDPSHPRVRRHGLGTGAFANLTAQERTPRRAVTVKPHRTTELWNKKEAPEQRGAPYVVISEAKARRSESTFRVWQHYWTSNAGQLAASALLLLSHVSAPTRPFRLSQSSPTATSASGPTHNLDTGHKVSVPKQRLNRPPSRAEKSAGSTKLAAGRGEVRDKASVHKQCAGALFAAGRSVGEVQPAQLHAMHWRDFAGLPCSNQDAIGHSFICASVGASKNLSGERGREPQECT